MIVRLRVLLLALSLTSTWACKEKPARPQAKIRSVKYAEVGASGTSGARAVSGSIIARDATQLSFRVAGNLSVLNVKMGDEVSKDQVIAKLDDSDYKVALSQAQANYQSAKTARDTARSRFNRVERLFEAGSSSQADYEAAKGNLQATQAQLTASGQTVKQSRNQRQYTILTTPFAGVINSVSAKEGEGIRVGQAVVVVSRGGELEVAVGVPSVLISSVTVGTKASVMVSALGDKSFPAKVREVGFASESSTYPARVSLDQPNSDLRPGMAASATFELGTKTVAMSIPASGVANAEDGSFVFLLEPGANESYTVKHQKVEVGELLGGAFEIVKGLKSGDKVAIAGLGSLVDGMNVRLLVATSPGKAPTPSQATETP